MSWIKEKENINVNYILISWQRKRDPHQYYISLSKGLRTETTCYESSPKLNPKTPRHEKHSITSKKLIVESLYQFNPYIIGKIVTIVIIKLIISLLSEC